MAIPCNDRAWDGESNRGSANNGVCGVLSDSSSYIRKIQSRQLQRETHFARTEQCGYQVDEVRTVFVRMGSPGYWESGGITLLVLQNDVPRFLSDGMFSTQKALQTPLRARRVHLQRMNDTWDVTKNGEEDVDEQVTTAATFHEDTKRWKDDGKDDFADISVCESCQLRVDTHESAVIQ